MGEKYSRSCLSRGLAVRDAGAMGINSNIYGKCVKSDEERGRRISAMKDKHMVGR